MRLPLWRRLVGGMSCLLAAAALLLPAYRWAGAQPDPRFAEAHARLESYFAFQQRLSEELDRSPFDIAAKAASLGRDVGAIFAFVRDEVRYEAYAGSLRGAKGTLEGLAGNALDQSLLLAALLGEAGIAGVRVVGGTLDAPHVERLRTAMLEGGEVFRLPAGEPPGDGEMAELAAAFGIDAQELSAALAESDVAQQMFLLELRALAEADAGRLAQGLDLAGLPLDDGVVDKAALEAAMAAHYWVEIENAAGESLALDPSFPDAVAGARFAGAAFVVDEAALAERQHAATVRLLVERLEGGALVSETIWEKGFAGGAITEAVIEFQIVPSDLDAEGVRAGTLAPEAMVAQIEASEGFQPVVRVNGEFLAAFPFDRQGKKRTVSGGALQPAMDAITNTLDSLFGGGGGAPPSELAALWLEIDYRAPDDDGGRLYRSALFDRVQAETRAAPAPALEAMGGDELAWRLLLQGELAMPAFVQSRAKLAARALEHALASQPLYETLLAKRFGQAPEAPPIPPEAPALAPRVLSWVALTEALAVRPAMGGGLVAYYAEPRAVVYLEHLARAESGELYKTGLYDVLANPLRAVHDSAEDQGARRARGYLLVQGAADTLVEGWLLGAGPVRNGHTLILAAIEQEIPFEILGRARLHEADALPYPAAARHHLRAELEAGYVALAPARPVRIGEHAYTGWWRYDPASGVVLGRGGNGRGDAFAEYLTPTNAVIGAMVGAMLAPPICNYVHRGNHAEAQVCAWRAMVTAFAVALAAITVIPALGGTYGAMALFGAGEILAAYGLVANNALALDIGLGLMLEPVGALAAAHVLTPLFRGGWHLMGPRLARILSALRGGADEAIEVAMPDGQRIRVFMQNADELGDAVFSTGGGEAVRQERRQLWRQFERHVRGMLEEFPSDRPLRALQNAAGDPLPQMVRTIEGQFNRSGWGIDLFGIDHAGNIWVIEAKLGVQRGAGWFAELNPVRYALDQPQMSAAWRWYAARRLAETPEGLQQIRHLLSASDDVSGLADEALRDLFLRRVENGRAAIVVREGTHVEIPPGTDLNDIQHVFTTPYRFGF